MSLVQHGNEGMCPFKIDLVSVAFLISSQRKEIHLMTYKSARWDSDRNEVSPGSIKYEAPTVLSGLKLI